MAFDAPRFKDPDAARQYLESVRWPDGPICPHCGVIGRGGGKFVEADEAYVGRKAGTKKNRGPSHKEAVLALVERGGELRTFHVPDVTAATLRAKLREHVDKQANMMTDEAKQYHG